MNAPISYESDANWGAKCATPTPLSLMPKQTRCCPCKWTGCHDAFETVEILYEHLCNEHIGRKATHNLCLECRWDECGAQAAKRDHLASHLLVHLPLKPHQCSTCKKAFKRPQDLKKHEKIHTIEHKASLISKQPGYKAVRRRKHQSHTTKSSSDWHTQATSPSSNKTDTDFSGSSSHVPSNSGNSSLFIRKQSPISMNPVQDLFQQVVDNTALSPEYNDEMMDRLEYISAAVQHQSNEWIPPVDNPNDLDTLQSWLEQLSANIQTDTCLYPDLATTQPPSTSSASDNDLYLYSNEFLDNISNTPSPPDWKTLMMTSTENPLAASVLLNHSQNSHTSPSISSQHHPSPSSTSSSSPEDPSSSTATAATTIGASFWTPACDLPPVDEKKESIDGPTPSDSVDFSPPVMVYSEKQPIHLFESSSEKTQMAAAAQTKQRHSPMSHEDKRNVIRMLNVLSAPDNDGDQRVASSRTTSSSTVSPIKKEVENNAPESKSPMVNSTCTTHGGVLRVLDDNKDTKEDSPYAGLLEKLRDLSFDDSDDASDDMQQQRHVDTVNYLWDAVMRAKKTMTKPSRSSSNETRRHGDTQQHTSTTSTPLISV